MIISKNQPITGTEVGAISIWFKADFTFHQFLFGFVRTDLVHFQFQEPDRAHPIIEVGAPIVFRWCQYRLAIGVNNRLEETC